MGLEVVGGVLGSNLLKVQSFSKLIKSITVVAGFNE